jgi:hypothetical protein
MIKIGYIPANFNISKLTLIPKKGECESPGDFRPISVSTAMCSVFESLLLTKFTFISEIHQNQFGYKPYTSCKHAYYAVYETINYYKNGDSHVYCKSLDATKAFDKLWRAGLFFKLMSKLSLSIWRALYLYYQNSKIIINLDGKMSRIIETKEGV